jgi:hypothetical protein
MFKTQDLSRRLNLMIRDRKAATQASDCSRVTTLLLQTRASPVKFLALAYRTVGALATNKGYGHLLWLQKRLQIRAGRRVACTSEAYRATSFAAPSDRLPTKRLPR